MKAIAVMTFLLNARFYWKNAGQGDEKAGKTAQKLSNDPPCQQTRALRQIRIVDKPS
jgi:hypothetical protein